MHYRKEPTEFEQRWLGRIERRSERRSEWKRLRRLHRHRRLYRLGLLALGFCFTLLAGAVVFIVFTVLLLLLHLLLLL
jgi:hypothetical protein